MPRPTTEAKSTGENLNDNLRILKENLKPQKAPLTISKISPKGVSPFISLQNNISSSSNNSKHLLFQSAKTESSSTQQSPSSPKDNICLKVNGNISKQENVSNNNHLSQEESIDELCQAMNHNELILDLNGKSDFEKMVINELKSTEECIKTKELQDEPDDKHHYTFDGTIDLKFTPSKSRLEIGITCNKLYSSSNKNATLVDSINNDTYQQQTTNKKEQNMENNNLQGEKMTIKERSIPLITEKTPKENEKREKELIEILSPDPNVGEEVYFTSYCFLKKSSDKQNIEKVGYGMAQILQNNDNKRYRLLIRNENNLNTSILNCYILPFSKLYQCTPNILQFNAIDYKENVEKESFFIKFANQEVTEDFTNIYEQALSCNKKLLDSMNK